MTAAEALRDIRGYARANRIEYTNHVLDQMRARQVRERDVEHALSNATGCKWQPDKQTWKVNGKDLDGEDLVVAVAIEDGLIVVTVF